MKKCSGVAVLIAVTGLIMAGCSSNLQEKSFKSEKIVLGEKKVNPFSLRKAREVNSDVESNFMYFRLRTDSLEKLTELQNIYGELETVPMDYEIAEGGVSYDENGYTDTSSPWFYFMKPVEEYNHLCAEYEVELIEEMYVSEDDMNSIQAVFDSSVEENDGRWLWFSASVDKVPSGNISVYNSITKENDPLRNTKVEVSQMWWSDTMYTDSNGNFNLGKNYSSFWGNVRIKIIFENNNSTVCEAGSIFTSSYTAGEWSDGSWEGVSITLDENTLQNKLGTVINAAEKYRDFAVSDGVENPCKLKYWITDMTSGGITLMKDVAWSTLVETTWMVSSFIPNPLIYGICIGTAAVVGACLPDIIIGCKVMYTYTVTEVIYNNVFHESAHASHYCSLGNDGFSYWKNEYSEMFIGWLKLFCNGEDPWTNCYCNGESKLVCFIESWAYFYGDYLMHRYFSDKVVGSYFYNLNNTGSINRESFFYHEAFYDLIDFKQKQNESDKDDIFYGYTVKNIFDMYRKKITSCREFINEFTTVNGLEDKKTELENIFINAGAVL